MSRRNGVTQGGQRPNAPMVRWGQDKQFLGVPKAQQRRQIGSAPGGLPGGPNQPGGAPPGAPGGQGHLSDLLAGGILPDRFKKAGFNLGSGGKISMNANHAGVQSAKVNSMYQKLYNAVQGTDTKLFGQNGSGGLYNPQVLYAQPNRYVDMRTGLANPPSTGASADAGSFIGPELLARLQQKSGFDPAAAAASANSQALGPGDGSPGSYTNLGQGYVAPVAAPGGGYPQPGPHGLPGQTPPINPGLPGQGQSTGTNNSLGSITSGWAQNPQGQAMRSGGPQAAGRTGLGQAANNRPASPGGPGGAGGPGAPSNAPQNFLPMTPQAEAGQRSLEDNLAAQLAQIGVARDQIPAYLALMSGRAGTDQTYATQGFNSAMADRGIYDSGVTPYLKQRDIGIPYGRQAQDLGLSAAGQYSDLAAQQGQAYLGYDQGLTNLLLQRALQVSQQMPLSLPQYKNKPKPRRNRSRQNNRGN